MLSIENISVKISNSVILRDVTMFAKEGLITCIMGKNGMGKTTLLETIIGHYKNFKGKIKLHDKNIEKLSPFERAQLGLAYVPQGREIFPRLTVNENLLTGLSSDSRLEEWSWGNDAFGQLSGQVVHYGPRSYLPDKPTSNAIVRVRLRNPTLAGVRPDIWAAADDSGFFNIPGIESKIIYTKPVRVEGYALAFDGSITDAPDWGINEQTGKCWFYGG